jgi:hypothetical protein
MVFRYHQFKLKVSFDLKELVSLDNEIESKDFKSTVQIITFFTNLFKFDFYKIFV